MTIQRRENQQAQRESSSEKSAYPVNISNLPYSVDKEQLKEAFKEFGKVVHASVTLNEEGLSTGYGIVEFSTKEAAENAAKTMDKANFNKREVSCKIHF